MDDAALEPVLPQSPEKLLEFDGSARGACGLAFDDKPRVSAFASASCFRMAAISLSVSPAAGAVFEAGLFRNIAAGNLSLLDFQAVVELHRPCLRISFPQCLRECVS